MQDLGTLGGPFSGAAAINGSGQVAGFAALPPDSTGDIPDHAFIYTGGKLKDIGTLPGNRDSEAFGINSKGWVVGTSENPLGPAHAFLYRDGKMTDLGTLAGGQSFANAVNDDGIVVGDSLVATSTHHAFIYRGGKLRDLNGLIDTKSGWTLVSATGINNLGKITGVGLIHGQEHAFLLVPARIEGLVYRDANANGRRDAAEKGLAGVKVFIDLVGDGKFRTTDPTAITDANGHYSFGSLDAGHYEIRVVRPSGFATTAPKNGLRTVDLSLGELQTGVRFGLIASNVG
jgi:probable HAF family extracellular repeat protein